MPQSGKKILRGADGDRAQSQEQSAHLGLYFIQFGALALLQSPSTSRRELDTKSLGGPPVGP